MYQAFSIVFEVWKGTKLTHFFAAKKKFKKKYNLTLNSPIIKILMQEEDAVRLIFILLYINPKKILFRKKWEGCPLPTPKLMLRV